MALLALWLAAAGCGRDAARGSPAADASVAGTIGIDHHILVDQFGYLPDEAKVAVLRDPQVGYDKTDRFSPGQTYQVRRADNGAVVFTGVPVPWRSGITQESSGDRGWWFDFSTLTAPGKYFVFDIAKKTRSPTFNIDAEVYKDVLKAAMRTYYYQRSGFAKQAPHAEACWSDDAAYAGKNQDREAHDITDKDNAGKTRDLSGGWFDAGDTNKYLTFAVQPVHQLLHAFAANKAAFGDDFNIPESGNGIPDVLDEVKWETDWLKRMQYADGSFALKVGETVYVNASPPSSDRSPRFYVPSCSSATIAASGMLAHAALVYRDYPGLVNEAEDSGRRARIAWKNYQSIPAKQTSCDNNVVHTANADLLVDEQTNLATEAAVYLFALTGDPSYEDFVIQHYKQMQPFNDIGWSRYKPDQGEALLYYTTLPGANAGLKEAILSQKLADMKAGNQIYGFVADDDLYRAFLHDAQYHWGSSNPRANYGNTNLDAIRFGLAGKEAPLYRARALEMLHYFHGVNPLGMVYMSNMYSYGATLSANEIFHAWFQHGTQWSDAKSSSCGPAPGFVPGGPNRDAAKNGVPAALSPPVNQPPQKSYKDWNLSGADSSWAVTEPAIYYQSAYVELLSAFVK